MYHRHHSWQHDLYPSSPWPDYPDALAPPLPPPPPPLAPYIHDRLALAGSLDPATGIFYRSPEHPRLRTAQACEKCRTRKAKCSGEHPTCKRCAARGLVCEYAKEGRVRGPNKPKAKASASASAPSADTKDTPGESSASARKEAPSAEIADLLPAPAPPPPPRRHSDRAVRPRPSTLRLPGPRTPHPFAGAYPDGAESSGRRSCSTSLSESGGSSVPSSAVSTTFELSPSPAQAFANTPSTDAGYPPGTNIHQLTHEHQQRLLCAAELDLCASHPHQQQQYAHPVKQEHEHEHEMRFHETQYAVPVAGSLPLHSHVQHPHPHQHQHQHQHQHPQHQHAQHQHQHPQQYTPVPLPLLPDLTEYTPWQMHYTYDARAYTDGGGGDSGAFRQ